VSNNNGLRAQQDKLVYGLAADGTVRCMAAVTTIAVAEAVRRHGASPTVAAALGRTMTGTLLLGASLKELDRLTTQIVASGPVGSITAETNAKGEIRGYVRNPEVDAPLNAAGKLDVSSVVGGGMLHVIRESGYEEGLYTDPYTGSVPIVSGEIAEDFSYYLTKSEQIPSAVLLGVFVQAQPSREHFVSAAGGVMIQIMPGAGERTIAAIENSVQQMPHTTTLIRAGATPTDLLRAALGPLELELLEEKPVTFACTCSYERALSLISAIERSEIQSMIAEDKGAVMTCHFCNETYNLDEKALITILANG
jgi:molecular chaperone Hsp33